MSDVRVRGALCLSILIALLACLGLGSIVHRTAWTMDADEAVHALEALRLHDHLADGRLGELARDTWFPERWQPPVNPHVRWYPFVHAWSLLPSFAILGPSDFSARIPSVVLLFGTCLVFFELGRRLSPRHGAVSGLLAVVLLLSAPNVLTFSAQSLIEPASLFFCFLALLAYLWSLETEHTAGRAALAGLSLGLAMLTKYDHGGLLALGLGIAEGIRLGLGPRRIWSGPAILFLIAGATIGLWFAHPDKLDALGDSVSHPFYGTSRLILLDFAATWFTEYGSSIAMGGLALAAFVAGAKRLRDPALRALWIWLALSTLFLALRARFHFRYNFVEAPGFLLLAAILLPGQVECWAGKLAAPDTRGRLRVGVLAVAIGVLGTFLGGWLALDPEAFFAGLRAPFAWFHGLREDHWGMSREPEVYVQHYADGYRDLVVYLGGSLIALALGFLVLGLGALVFERRHAERGLATPVLAFALAIAVLPGVARLYARLGGMVEWELECHPELADVYAFVDRHVSRDASHTSSDGTTTVLLGGGWDQLTNNGLRWYLLTRGAGEQGYDDVRVVGDMIGSLVFPPEPRIAHWARVLATAPEGELPDRIVLVEPVEGFLYQARMGPEVAVYDEILARRPGYSLLERARFTTLGCDVRVLARGDVAPPIEGVEEILASHGVTPDAEAGASRVLSGEGGWVTKDDALRHFVSR